MAFQQQPEHPLRRPIAQAAAVTALLVAALALRLPLLGLELRLWLVALGAIAAGAVTGRALAGHRVGDEGLRLRLRWGWWQRRPEPRVRPLEELEHAVEFSLGTAFDVHYRLRPHLRGIAAHRLAIRGVSLDGQHERARAVLGEEAWDLVRPGRPEPEDRNGPGLDLSQVRRVVDVLDAL